VQQDLEEIKLVLQKDKAAAVHVNLGKGGTLTLHGASMECEFQITVMLNSRPGTNKLVMKVTPEL
jgi:hypothetical protein